MNQNKDKRPAGVMTYAGRFPKNTPIEVTSQDSYNGRFGRVVSDENDAHNINRVELENFDVELEFLDTELREEKK